MVIVNGRVRKNMIGGGEGECRIWEGIHRRVKWEGVIERGGESRNIVEGRRRESF